MFIIYFNYKKFMNLLQSLTIIMYALWIINVIRYMIYKYLINNEKKLIYIWYSMALIPFGILMFIYTNIYKTEETDGLNLFTVLGLYAIVYIYLL